MQLRLNPRQKESFFQKRLVIKIVFFATIFSIAIFLIDKIEKPAPSKLIKHKISNDKLITIK